MAEGLIGNGITLDEMLAATRGRYGLMFRPYAHDEASVAAHEAQSGESAEGGTFSLTGAEVEPVTDDQIDGECS